MNTNKILTITILLFHVFICVGQEKWTLYPEKISTNSNDSLTKYISTIEILDDTNREPLSLKDTMQSNYIRTKGSVNLTIDSRITMLNKYLAENGKYKGFSVQITVSQENQKIRNLRKIFIENFPDEIIFDEYIAPNIFLYAGKFQNMNDAINFKKNLEPLFSNTMVVGKSYAIGTEKKD
jgi:hypothetical protein